MILLAYLAGMWIDVMEIDATQYAGMSRKIMQSGDYFHFFDHGRPYLDKPPLTFWLTALSFRLFGVATWSYKLPSVLFSLLAVIGTERLASLLHNRRTGELAALVFASAQAVFLMNNDVKIDMYMIAPMVLGTWLLVKWLRGGRWFHFLGGAMLLGVGMLAKGPLAVVAPGLAIGADILLRRDWAALFRWQWLLLLPIIGLVTAPWAVGQYEQYGWKGVEFFYWTQSFGRVTGQSEWENDATAFFFVHTFAWAFIPWTALFLWAFAMKGYEIVKGRFKLLKQGEAIAFGGFLLVFIALSLSRYKLPHYIFVTFPFAAILVAAFWVNASDEGRFQRGRKIMLIFQRVIWFIGAVVAGLLAFWAFPTSPIPPKVAFVVLAALFTVDLLKTKSEWQQLVWPTALGFALCNLLLNLSVYPSIMQFQSTAVAGKFYAQQGISGELYAYLRSGRALDFYGGKEVQPINDKSEFPKMLAQNPLTVYTTEQGWQIIQEQGIQAEVLLKMPHHAPSKMSITFINPATRAQTVNNTYLLRLPQQQLP